MPCDLVRADRQLLPDQELALDDLRVLELIPRRIALYELGRAAGGLLGAVGRLEDRDRDELAVIRVHEVVAVEARDLLQAGEELVLDPRLEAGEQVLGRAGILGGKAPDGGVHRSLLKRWWVQRKKPAEQ